MQIFQRYNRGAPAEAAGSISHPKFLVTLFLSEESKSQVAEQESVSCHHAEQYGAEDHEKSGRQSSVALNQTE